MRLLFPFAVLLLCASAAAAQPASTFTLPPDPDATPTSRPQVQGPVDTESEVPSVPRVIGAPTPQPTRTAPTPRPTASPRATPTPAPSRTAAPQPAASTPSPSLPASERSVPTREVLSQPDTASSPMADEPAPEQDRAAAPADQDRSVTPIEEEAGALGLPEVSGSEDTASAGVSDQPDAPSFPLWLAGALAAALLVLGAIAFAVMRRRKPAPDEPAEVVNPAGAPRHAVREDNSVARPDAGSLEVEAYAVTLSRSVMNASISYRVTMINRGRVPMTQVQVHGDVTTAHGRVPVTQQLADATQALPELHSLARLEPGQRITVHGDLRLPLGQVRALLQGQVPVFVPLLRLTVRAADMEPRAFTYVIGTRSTQKGARPTPFRLDGPPRSYDKLTTRAVA